MIQWGGSDYSMSVGKPGQNSSPEIKEVEKYVIESALKKGVQPRAEAFEVLMESRLGRSIHGIALSPPISRDGSHRHQVALRREAGKARRAGVRQFAEGETDAVVGPDHASGLPIDGVDEHAHRGPDSRGEIDNVPVKDRPAPYRPERYQPGIAQVTVRPTTFRGA